MLLLGVLMESELVLEVAVAKTPHLGWQTISMLSQDGSIKGEPS